MGSVMKATIWILVLEAVSAYQVPPTALPMRGLAPASPLLTPIREQPARAVQPRMALEPSLLLSMELLGTEVNNGVVGVGAVVAFAAFAWSLRTSFAGGAAIILLLLGGDPEERVASGANDNEVSTSAHHLCTPLHCTYLNTYAYTSTSLRTSAHLCAPLRTSAHSCTPLRSSTPVCVPQMLKNIATAITPSAWKKSYQGVGEGEDQPPKVLLDLPAWQGDEARELEEPEEPVTRHEWGY